MLKVKIPGERTIRLVEENKPNPGKGQVRIAMKASALCRSDLHRYHGNNLFTDTDDASITPGHEPCGIVDALGEGVTRVRRGDRVAVFLGLGCGVCPHCLRGDVVLCPAFGCIGFAVNGAHADYMIIPEENCLPLPEEMSFVAGALATDVAGTLYTACRDLGMSGAKTLAMVGCGQMGSGGILMAKGFGARVVAIDANPGRLRLAEALGADLLVNPAETDPVAAVKAFTGGRGADAAIVCASGTEALNIALNAVAAKGGVGVIGESNTATIDPSNQFIRKTVSLRGCWYFNRGDWEEIAGFIVRNKIPLEKICSHTFPLSEAETAFPLFDSRQAHKVVFVWD